MAVLAKLVQMRYFRDMSSLRKMGRPTLYKKGAMTAAQRQRRHRAKLRREKKEELVAMRARNAAEAARHSPRWTTLYLKQSEENRIWWLWWPEWLNMRGRLDELPNADIADELVRQLAEAIMPDRISIADIRQALDRRFGTDEP